MDGKRWFGKHTMTDVKQDLWFTDLKLILDVAKDSEACD
jgi:hypothetical protein